MSRVKKTDASTVSDPSDGDFDSDDSMKMSRPPKKKAVKPKGKAANKKPSPNKKEKKPKDDEAEGKMDDDEDDEQKGLAEDYDEENLLNIQVPDKPIPCMATEGGQRLMITDIEVENFKSYYGTRTIGPFNQSFTAIIGPNGSGKSNVIDALLFVFGYKASKIRSKKVSVLIHSSKGKDEIPSCTVKISFQKIVDRNDGTYDIVPNSHFYVSRTAFRTNQSEYRLDGKKATFKEVAVRLKAVGIDLIHNRFLILQGEVEQIAMMKPKAVKDGEDGMLEYLEDIIGSSRFKMPIEKLAAKLEKLGVERTAQIARKRNRQVSVERTPRKRKAKDDDEEEEEEAEKRKKRRAANVAVAAMADQGESTEEEREHDEALDEFPAYYRKDVTPKVLITMSPYAKVRTWRLCYELLRAIPHAELFSRKGVPLKKVVEQARRKGYTDLLVVDENMREPNGIVFCHLPEGPTAYFKINNLTFTKDIKKTGDATDHYPEVVVNNFNTRLGHTISRMFTCLFPQNPEFKGRRVVTLHNQRDKVFFGHHRYEFKKEGTKAALLELGPRMTLRLKWLQKGTFDTRCGEFEWVLKTSLPPSVGEDYQEGVSPPFDNDAESVMEGGGAAPASPPQSMIDETVYEEDEVVDSDYEQAPEEEQRYMRNLSTVPEEGEGEGLEGEESRRGFDHSASFVSGAKAMDRINQEELIRQKQQIFIQDDPRFNNSYNPKEHSWEPSPNTSRHSVYVSTPNDRLTKKSHTRSLRDQFLNVSAISETENISGRRPTKVTVCVPTPLNRRFGDEGMARTLSQSKLKSALREALEVNAELKGALKAEKEAHMKSNKQNAEFVEVLKREAINKDDAMRLLHNEVVDLRGRIRVSVRVRPLLAAEAGESTEHLSYPDQTTVAIEQKGKVQPFGFNHVYGPNESQVRIFDGCKDLILSVLHGYNVSIISYGQTGSGKTHTMRGGEDEAAGLIPRAVRFLFENRSRLEDLDWKFEFAASFLEVYNNDCYDLLSTPPRAKREIKQQNDKFVVDGLTVEAIDDVHKMATLLRKSDANRSTAATKCNETSSRSHAVFALSIKGVNGTTGAKIDCVLKLVDLAGSERAKETGAVGDRFTEMTHINTALSNLQSCIRAILTKQQHVPYRNSKLTTLLQDSLSGGSKCMVILSLSPQLTQMNEAKRTLEFGRNLSQTHIGAAKKKET